MFLYKDRNNCSLTVLQSTKEGHAITFLKVLAFPRFPIGYVTRLPEVFKDSDESERLTSDYLVNLRDCLKLICKRTKAGVSTLIVGKI